MCLSPHRHKHDTIIPLIRKLEQLIKVKLNRARSKNSKRVNLDKGYTDNTDRQIDRQRDR